MESSLRGRRVQLVRCTDEHTNLEPGIQGTIQFVDSLGTIHIKWDDGSRLGLIPEAGDNYVLLDD